MAKRKHFVDTDTISHVEFIERRKQGYIKFTATIDGKKHQETEIKEEEYGRMLNDGYYIS